MVKNNKKLKILLFGGSGLVGSRIRELLGTKYQISAPLHSKIDVTDKIETGKIVDKLKPDYIIYAAGLTSVEKAEEDPKLAYLLNAQAPFLIAKKASLLNIPLLYFSTDAVFDGTKQDKPYIENDKTNPISEYGRSKLLGEQKVMGESSRNCIVRVIMVYSPINVERKRFTQIALEALKKGEKFYGVVDQVINPTYADDIATAVDLFINHKSKGIYHLGATDYVTNFEFIQKLSRGFNFDEKNVVGLSLEEFFKGKKAIRTKFCWLDTTKFRKEFGSNILHSTDEGVELLKKNLYSA